MAWIELEGAVNVRDVGGTPTADGGDVVYRRLLRSENLQELTEADVALLVDELGLTTVVDLRSTRELMTEGPAPLDAVDGVQHAHHPVLKEFLDASDTVAAALLLTAQQEDAERYPDDLMTGHYLGYLENRPEEVVGALRSIVTAPGAAIVHCAAGKDRTGVVVALALTIAGVDPEVIVADYVATNERIEQIIDRLSRAKMYRDVTDKPVAAHEARAETMRAFLKQLDVRYGGLEPWLARQGFTADEVAGLRARLEAADDRGRPRLPGRRVRHDPPIHVRGAGRRRLPSRSASASSDWLAELEKTRLDRDRGKAEHRRRVPPGAA